MSQLTAVDAGFLNIEGDRTRAHIGGLGIIDTTLCPGGRLTRADMVELVRERAHLARPLRSRLVQVPFGLDHPYWEDDRDFDAERHVHEVALPYPGDDRQLGLEVARIHERPLDRRRPLWELYLIQGLEGGRAAIYCKVHHACVDGVLAAETLAALLDLSPEGNTPPPFAGEPLTPPGLVPMLTQSARRVALHPVRTAEALARTVPYLDQLPIVGHLPGVREVSSALRKALGKENPQPAEVGPAPRTPFNAPISQHRAFAFGSLPLEDVKEVRRALGVSVNDVVMAMCTGALRQWLIDHDALPDQPLISVVPVSLRRRHGRDDGNALSAMFAPLPVHIADPEDRFYAVRGSMRGVKRRFAVSSGTWFEELTGILPPAVAGMATKLVLSAVPALNPVNLLISNVPGPQQPLYARGARVLAYYPASVITDATGGVNITVFSYDGNLDIGIIACPDLVPDSWNLVDYLRDSLSELQKLTKVPAEV
ncbi:wax ester/triacylglycerol synthase family O-acyltransferase [Actinocorallia sp. A-T 12471]|uniref:WS/DGAT/MGAT family O-acyltransferase n=1 Tax=Actinocorallia sp. A-T 12471 TaxID=3089813 RepID=UPI0029D22265|nr:wax ester/triacylglycerol synthase family O-acyltransferase [Actinocorallia sp. A-T 12471]MDX6743589.1 wax ester/triacylglycerol synthase family O-acyltransferase [Actinocorallia sp. A-T 12471]